MTALNRDELIRRILSVSTGCSDEQLGVMMRALCDTLGGRMMSRSSNAAFVAQILAAHATCRAGQLRAMFHPLSLSLEMETVLPDIMRAGASPMKTGMLLAAAIDCCACLASSRRLFASLLATIKVAPSHRAYVDAGFYAACGDIDRVLTIEGLNDDDKLDFICYSCVELMPLDETSMPLQLGNILFLDVSRSLKTRALVLVLAKGPANPACFKLVRQWLIGILADITDIEWVRRDDLVEIRGDSRDYALWETDLTALYRDFREEMTDDFIKQETQLISRHPLLPSDVQRKLLALLDEVQSRRLEMTLRWSPESPEMNPSPC